jgi:hypothetical protein
MNRTNKRSVRISERYLCPAGTAGAESRCTAPDTCSYPAGAELFIAGHPATVGGPEPFIAGPAAVFPQPGEENTQPLQTRLVSDHQHSRSAFGTFHAHSSAFGGGNFSLPPKMQAGITMGTVTDGANAWNGLTRRGELQETEAEYRIGTGQWP